jgi:hypothetical protein
MEWIDDINNFLSEEDQTRLASGKFQVLVQGKAGEIYFAGLDTAYAEGRNSDRTVLSIWRLRRDGVVEKVSSFSWQGDPLAQEREIWEILNPRGGMFKCETVFADYSNIGVTMVERFRNLGMPIVGVTFGGSAKSVGSSKNWKNTLYDHFLVRLQSGEALYPNIEELRILGVDASPEFRVQVDNMLEGFWQWCILQRIRGRGLNDKIEAPTDQVEDEEDGQSKVAHDDIPSADILAVWAARHRDQMRKELAKGGGLMSSFEFPIPVFGGTFTAQPGHVTSRSDNPYANRPASASSAPMFGGDAQDGRTDMSGWIGLNNKK